MTSCRRYGFVARTDCALVPAAETPARESKAMTSTNTVLHGLVPAANYSVQVLAFTRAGDGVPSKAITCSTEEAGRSGVGAGRGERPRMAG